MRMQKSITKIMKLSAGTRSIMQQLTVRATWMGMMMATTALLTTCIFMDTNPGLRIVGMLAIHTTAITGVFMTHLYMALPLRGLLTAFMDIIIPIITTIRDMDIGEAITTIFMYSTIITAVRDTARQQNCIKKVREAVA